MNTAVEAAEKAFQPWKQLDSTQRRNILLVFADLLQKYNEELCYLTRITNGRLVSQQWEVYIASETFRLVCDTKNKGL